MPPFDQDKAQKISVALLTGGADRPYAYGLATELIASGIGLDIVGSDDLDSPEFHGKSGVSFLNLRGEQRPDASPMTKVRRVLAYYAKLIRYALRAKPRLFHILWNNKFEYFDRTMLMMFYKLLGKEIVLTVHNVNAAKRDSRDSALNRLTLKIQYKLASHVFVHSENMKQELVEEFSLRGLNISVIPFGINNAVPNTSLTRGQARERLGLPNRSKTILFFGHIAPYKGLEYLVTALQRHLAWPKDYRLIIAGRPKNCPTYWTEILSSIQANVAEGKILLREQFIPDEETEIYFKAADVLVLPYRYIYQSGVLFLGYSFGLPVLAADVGPLKEDVWEGHTGFVFQSEDAEDLAAAIKRYFDSDLFEQLDSRRAEIRDYAMERHSWNTVGQITIERYADLLQIPSIRAIPERESQNISFDINSHS
jgi:glycosyltransferase involved in cell wall biosynthesis